MTEQEQAEARAISIEALRSKSTVWLIDRESQWIADEAIARKEHKLMWAKIVQVALQRARLVLSEREEEVAQIYKQRRGEVCISNLECDYVVICKSAGMIPALTRCSKKAVADVIRECKQVYPDAELVVAWVQNNQVEIDCAETWLAIEEHAH